MAQDMAGRAGPRQRARAWAKSTFASMSERDVRMLWIATIPNHVGSMMAGTAQGVVAYDLTGSNAAVGAVLLGQGLAMTAVAPVAGALADRFSKRTLFLMTQAALLLNFLLIAVAIATDVITIPLLAAGAFVMGVMFVFLRTLRSAYAVDLASVAARPNAIALQQVAQAMGQITSPFFAGLLLGWSLVGPAGTYFVIVGLLAVAIVIVLRLPATPPPARTAASPGILGESWSGVVYGWRNPELRWVLGGFLVFALVGLPFQSLMPGYVSGELHMKTATLGVLLGVSAVGGLAVSIGVAGIAGTSRAPRVMLVSQTVFAVALMALSVAPGFGAALVVMLAVGAGSGGVQLISMSMALQVADRAYLGRVASLTMIGIAMNGLASLPVGFFADRWGEREVLFGLAVAVLGATGLMALWRSRMAAPAPARAAVPGGGGDRTEPTVAPRP